MVREELITGKMALLHRYLHELAAHRDITLEQYVTGGPTRWAVERLLQLIV